MLVGRAVPLGLPVVPEVYMRFGRGTCVVLLRQELLPRDEARCRSFDRSPTDDVTHSSGGGGGLGPDPDVLGSDEDRGGVRVRENVRRFVRREVEAHWHCGRAAQQTREIGHGGLGRVLGEDRHPSVGAEILTQEPVRATVDSTYQLAPPDDPVPVVDRDLRTTHLVGQPVHYLRSIPSHCSYSK